MPNFMLIGQTVAELWRFLDFFFKMAFICYLDLLYACLNHPRRVFAGVCHCAEFGRIRRSSFDNMQVLVLWTLGLKCVFIP